jgi:hypothetical protein
MDGAPVKKLYISPDRGAGDLRGKRNSILFLMDYFFNGVNIACAL